MSTNTAVALADVIAFARAQAEATARRNFTQLETGLIDAAEAQRRQALAEAVVVALEAFHELAPERGRAGRDPAAGIGARAAAMRPSRIPMLVASLRCGPAYWTDNFLAADMLLQAPSVRHTVLGIIEARMIEVIGNGSRRDG